MDEGTFYLRELAPDDDYIYLAYRPQRGTLKTTDPLTARCLDYTFKTRAQTDYVYCKIPKNVLHSFLMAYDTRVFDDGNTMEDVFPVAKKRKALRYEYAERWKKK